MADLFETKINKAFQALEAGDLDTAHLSFEKLRRERSDHVFVRFGCAAVAIQRREFFVAEREIRVAIRMAPHIPVLHELLGKALLAQGDPKSAEAAFRRALQLDPILVDSNANLAVILRQDGRQTDAIDHLRLAVERSPGIAVYRERLGSALWDVSQFEEALLHFEATVDLSTDKEIATLNLIDRYHTLAQSAEADRLIDSLDKLVGSRAYAPVLAGWRLPVIAAGRKDMDRRWELYEREVHMLADQDKAFDLNSLPSGHCNFYSAYQNRDVRRSQEVIAEFFLKNCPALAYQSTNLKTPGDQATGARIRIGFVSANMCNHTIGKLNAGLVSGLDREKFEVFVFSTTPPSDELGRRFEKDADHFITLPVSLEDRRQTIEKNLPDILYYPDIGMNLDTYYLAFSRLAPVQCAGLGHPVTTGIPTIDYFVSGDMLEPPGAQEFYSEMLVRLPTLPFAVWPLNVGRKTEPLDLEFSDGKHLYLCVQSLFKVHPDFDAVLRKILERDDKAVVAFIEGMPGWSQALKRRWIKSIPEAGNRIHFLQRLDQTAFLALIRAADILLDTIHFCGGNTTAETLGLGKIVVTWPGKLAAGRVSAGYYERLDIHDAIADSLEAYIDLAVGFACDPVRRKALERRIAAAADRLFDHQDTIAAFEAFFKSSLRAPVN
ncbi:MAG: tetratricopeptide repeat protein [Pseudomonadota bacterium]|nr:tetratricopeptide repeat protein [Pseudomonadota bacterium]